ncbi:MAG: COG1361 S-layer family protein [Thermanaerothrix sp.]|uniref:COG1361 S-layer family protein n=1 Tax=Thermanaerothrix sp. TaxID=2972675 RepID=UPI003C7C2E06
MITQGLNAWPVTTDPLTFTLAASESRNVIVAVAVPATAPNGATEVTTVQLLEATTNTGLGSVALTTRAFVPPTATLPPSGRPLVVMESYGIEEGGPIAPGQEFGLRLRMANVGRSAARDIIFTFSGEGFLPLNTGGVRTLSGLAPEERLDVVQRFLASPTLSGSLATITVNVTYNDPAGTAYTTTLTVTIDLKPPAYASGPARPTATPTAISRPQLVVMGYRSDVDQLQPGSIFTLDLEIENLGSSNARNVVMILGGGTLSGDNSGTPAPGGVSASGSDLSTFAPLGSSNIIYLGDVPLGQALKTSTQLIVNVNANPGAYPFKISFVYDDEKGNRQVNDQVITLLVYSLPQVEVGFYRDPGFFQAGMPAVLPLQVTNLGRKSAVLGNMKVSAENAELSNNVSLVGALEPGGYFTLDVNFTPYQAGSQDITVTITYTDDFNQPRSIIQTLTVDVMEAPVMETPMFPGEGGLPAEPTAPETFWDVLWRFIKGLLGLGSGRPQPTPITPEMPPGEVPVPVPVGPGGKG